MEQQHELSRGELEKYFGIPLHLAAAMLGMSLDTLRQNCRNFNIKRWPSKNYKKNNTKRRKTQMDLIPKSSDLSSTTETNEIMSNPIVDRVKETMEIEFEFDQEIDDLYSSETISNDNFDLFSLNQLELFNVFKFLDFSSIINVSMVCKEFNLMNQKELMEMKKIYFNSKDFSFLTIRIGKEKLLNDN